jgi:GPH family glycoside/pentoside/hexuronide:cation symporter
MPPLSLGRRIGYALGNAGFQITGATVVGIGLYYYLPPGDVPDLRPQLSAGVFLGVFTAYGLARLVGGLVDSLADPFVGHWSDRSRSRLGRRRSFMIYGILPMVGLPVLLFWTPGAPGSTGNFYFLALVLALYFIFFTVYVGPYLALMPEIARSTEERVSLSKLFAIVGFPVLALFGPGWQLGVDRLVEAGYGTEAALRAVVVALSALALVTCLVPILVVDERRIPNSVPSDLGFREAVWVTLRNPPFLVYLFAQILFILGVQMVTPWIPYLAQVILGRDLAFASVLGLVAVVPGIAGFFLAERIVARLGPKGTVVGAVATLGVLLCALGALHPDVPGGPNDRWNLMLVGGVMALLGPTIAAFLILPNVIIGQLIDADEARTGANRSAMFFGAQGLFTKWAYAASAAIMSFLFVRWGNSQAQPLGVLLVGPVAGGLCLVSALLYALYPERQVLEAGRGVSEGGREGGGREVLRVRPARLPDPRSGAGSGPRASR